MPFYWVAHRYSMIVDFYYPSGTVVIEEVDVLVIEIEVGVGWDTLENSSF